MNKPQLTSVAFADFKKAEGIVSVSPKVRKSENGLFVTFLTDKKDADGKTIAKNIWFARSVVDAGKVSEGQSIAELDIPSMIVCNTINEAEALKMKADPSYVPELREKLAYPGASTYIAI